MFDLTGLKAFRSSMTMSSFVIEFLLKLTNNQLNTKSNIFLCYSNIFLFISHMQYKCFIPHLYIVLIIFVLHRMKDIDHCNRTHRLVIKEYELLL